MNVNQVEFVQEQVPQRIRNHIIVQFTDAMYNMQDIYVQHPFNLLWKDFIHFVNLLNDICPQQ